jgi:uncharacterized Ntn-hydrolase superfamily protein
MRSQLLISFFCLQTFVCLKAQDTFSILAFDSLTGEVGAAGASCVDLFQLPGTANDFITEIIPGEGAIATQASYLQTNQQNARWEFLGGDSPTQIISWLQANDAANDPTVRQYGVVRMNAGYPQTAAHTGSNCLNYKNHKLGPNYSIQGNILLGAQVLDSMEARFNREPGDLACKLMAALQGAKMIGADSRCAPNGSSALFAFIKVSQPGDAFGQPAFLLSLKTHTNAGIEPIDSLQAMFNQVKSCTLTTVGIEKIKQLALDFFIYPNPSGGSIKLKTWSALPSHCVIRSITGEIVFEANFTKELSISTEIWKKGVFSVEIATEGSLVTKKLVLSD